ncbi:MAG: VWA domain-containing protein [Pyrinomonadaceae bacterium]
MKQKRGRRATTQRPATAQTTPTPAQQPVRVPQLSPTSQQSAQPIRTPQQTATPKPTPSPAPPADVIDDDEIVRVTSNLVVVPASVTTGQGEPVQGLKATDFRLEEEGHAQEIAQIGDAEQVPLDIAILFDVSSSVMGKIAFTFQQESAAQFLKQVLKPVDRAAIITIADKPTLVQPLASASDASAKLVTIPAATTSVPTAFYDTVSFAAKYLAENVPPGHRRVILVLSDGDDNFSNAVREQSLAEYEAQKKAEAEGKNSMKTVRAAVHRDLLARHQRAVETEQRAVQRADIVFYSINPGGPSIRLNEIAARAQTGMQQLAEATGGTAYVPENTNALPTVFRQIANELRAQYLLQYYSNSNAPNGKYLNIKVTSPTHPDLRIRARQGYYVKK